MHASSGSSIGSVADVERKKRLVLIAAIIGSAVVSVDSTVVNVALPAIRADLGGGLAGQQWIVEAYLLTLGSLILIGGSLGDLFGERRIFALGICGFGVASLLCAIAPTTSCSSRRARFRASPARCWSRAPLAVIVADFPATSAGARSAPGPRGPGSRTVVGPLVGGALVGTASWRWIFAINLPLVLATLFLIPRACRPAPRARARKRRRAAARRCARSAWPVRVRLIEQPLYGWGSPRVSGPLSPASRCSPAFLAARVRARREPMLPLSLFQRRNFAVGNLATLRCTAASAVPFFFLVALPAADRRLLRARGGPRDAAGDAPDVLSLGPLRRAGRPLRPAVLHVAPAR